MVQFILQGFLKVKIKSPNQQKNGSVTNRMSKMIFMTKNKLQFMYIIVVVPRGMYIFCDSSSRPNL